MTFFCEDCKYINECKPRKNSPQAIGCCDFGLLDKNGLIEDWDELGEEPYTEEQVKLLVILNNLIQDNKENEETESLCYSCEEGENFGDWDYEDWVCCRCHRDERLPKGESCEFYKKFGMDNEENKE